MKLVKSTLYILALLITVIAFALIALTTLVNPDRLKPVITAEVEKQTGYKLAIDGHLRWSFYPRFGINIQHMSITAPQQPVAFADMNGVTIGVEFMQLLRGEKKLLGNVRIAKLKLMNINATRAKVDMQWENNVLTLSPISAALYDGWLEGSANGKELSATPKWDWNLQFNRIQMQPLLRDINGKDNKITIAGVAQMKMQANTFGKDKREMTSHLNGTIDFSVVNGTVSGINLNYLVQTAEALLTKQPLTTPDNLDQTTFESLTATYSIKDGVASTQNMILVSSAFTTKAEGSIDLSHQVMDYSLEIVPQHVEKMKWSVPVLVSGDVNDPSIKVDTLKMNTIIANEQFQKVKEKMQDKIKKLPKQVDGLLKKVLGN
jgi:uncharacterized protein involved in outer membrane biogenesis